MELYKIWKGMNNMVYEFMFKFNPNMYWREVRAQEDLFDGDNLMAQTTMTRNIRKGRVIQNAVLKDMLVGSTVLEVGAGRGYTSNIMHQWGYLVHSTDLTYDNGNRLDITKEPLPTQYDNVVSIGVLHHILNDYAFRRALHNIRAMAKHRVIIGVKINNPKQFTAKQRSLDEYVSVFGKPLLIKDAEYLTMLVFDK